MGRYVLDGRTWWGSGDSNGRAMPVRHPAGRSWRCMSKQFLAGLWMLAWGCAVSAAPFAYIATREAAAPGVVVIDVASQTVTATIPLAAVERVAASPDGRFVYASDALSSVSVISRATNSVVAVVPVGSGPSSLVVSPDGSLLYAVCSSDGFIAVIATATHQVIATIPVLRFLTDIVISPDGAFLYVANDSVRTVSVIDTATRAVVATLPTGASPWALAVDPRGAFVYVANFASDNVTVISTASREVVATIPVRMGSGPFVPKAIGPDGIAVTPDGAFVYVANSNSNNISMIDTATRAVVKLFPSGGRAPNGVGVTPDGAFLYVSNGIEDTVSVISTSTHEAVNLVKVGGRPLARGQFIGPAVAEDCDRGPGRHAHADNRRRHEAQDDQETRCADGHGHGHEHGHGGRGHRPAR